MPTHQSLGGSTDEDLLKRMVATHPERFDQAFWNFFAERVAPSMPAAPAIIDLGCGPGLFLHDLGARYPQARLYGYDVTPAMVAFGRGLPGARLEVAVLDVAAQPIPQPAESAHLVSMSSVLHVVDEPLPVLAEVRRVLAPGGVFLLHDWIRQPLETYLAWRRDTMKESEEESRRRGFRLFPAHNKYTPADWQWLLATAGFAVRHQTQLRPSHQIWVAVAAG